MRQHSHWEATAIRASSHAGQDFESCMCRQEAIASLLPAQWHGCQISGPASRSVAVCCRWRQLMARSSESVHGHPVAFLGLQCGWTEHFLDHTCGWVESRSMEPVVQGTGARHLKATGVRVRFSAPTPNRLCFSSCCYGLEPGLRARKSEATPARSSFVCSDHDRRSAVLSWLCQSRCACISTVSHVLSAMHNMLLTQTVSGDARHSCLCMEVMTPWCTTLW